MNEEIIPVLVKLSDGVLVQGHFILHEEAPLNSDAVELAVSFSKRTESVIASDFFDALAQLRRRLEADNIWLVCNGSVKNVYPSAMARSMGSGLKAYKLTLGKQAKTADLVPIFEESLNLPPCSVHIQEEFYREWLNSLR